MIKAHRTPGSAYVSLDHNILLKFLCLLSLSPAIMPEQQMKIDRLSPGDPSSFSRPEYCVVVHLHLNWDVNFDKKILNGSVELDLEKKKTDVDVVILDSKDLTIHRITDVETGQELKYSLGKPVGAFGSKLEIQLPRVKDKKLKIKIEYECSPEASALQWLTPEMTAGKKHPYLFSQCQAIHSRSIVPCQDTPSAKFTYTAKVTAPKDLTVLMSAVRQEGSGKGSHEFVQKVPIPSYLIAIVVGALESRKIGPRSHVWTEKEMIKEAEYEFAETEQFLKTAENLLGPYVWGVYDLLVLPPSFPYGGMENPCLTFVTPTLLAGDRSLADVVAHEISHSWTGNLVTNKDPEHFWLNEGHTVFVERKITGSMGPPHLRDFKMDSGWDTLRYAIDVFGEKSPLTHLVPDLTGIDPDDAFSSVPYEKGSTLLYYLEQQLGGPDVFEPFLRKYIENFKNQSITTDDWKKFLYNYFSDKVDILDAVDWKAWFNTPGMPPVKPKYNLSLLEPCIKLSQRWAKAEDEDVEKFTDEEWKNLTSIQIPKFLSLLMNEEPMSLEKIERMAVLYGLNKVKNSEIRFLWLRLCIKARYLPAVSRALEFVNEQGRMKFVRPIYRDLYGWEAVRKETVANFLKHRSQMHNIASTMVGKDLHIADGKHDEL
ncbi:leukotriene A-4 hydrolase [Lingula anatina]|uniref:Leukotriene A(4) hydrolase n=1 Tax=Lingula anatina TaxID=7574 RepID=A0A1S3HTK7_LINAN|nr:leukotriene A-4 hydrolase [Lingula anatina]|eukprot:XP_013388394.1 leukotriene A-4 hydrolase [Lingula anatina]